MPKHMSNMQYPVVSKASFIYPLSLAWGGRIGGPPQVDLTMGGKKQSVYNGKILKHPQAAVDGGLGPEYTTPIREGGGP